MTPEEAVQELLIVVAVAARLALFRFGELIVRTDAGLRVHAPEEMVVRRLDSRIGLRVNVHSFAAQAPAHLIGKLWQRIQHD